jgi:hypothetical protein
MHLRKRTPAQNDSAATLCKPARFSASFSVDRLCISLLRNSPLKKQKRTTAAMSLGDEESAQLSGGGSHHEKLMHHAIDIFCSRPLRNLDAGLLRSTFLAVLLRFSFLPPSRLVALSGLVSKHTHCLRQVTVDC